MDAETTPETVKEAIGRIAYLVGMLDGWLSSPRAMEGVCDEEARAAALIVELHNIFLDTLSPETAEARAEERQRSHDFAQALAEALNKNPQRAQSLT